MTSRAEGFVTGHPWLVVGTATATGVFIDRMSRRLPEGTADRASDVTGQLMSVARAAAIRYGATVGVNKLIGMFEESNRKEQIMEDKQDNGRAIKRTAAEAKGRLEGIGARAGDAVDSATSQVGRGMQRATEGVSRAGQYLEESSPGQMGSDITDLIRRHPKKSIAIGVGVGILVSRLLSR